MALTDGSVHVHLLDPERQSGTDLDRAWTTLDEEERLRADSFARDTDRRSYVAAHALLRTVLAVHTGASACELKFERTKHGRPELARAFAKCSVRFNLSHTRGLVGCAVTTAADIGFDLEQVREPAPLEVAESYFSPTELAFLRSLDARQSRERFYALWTLKEAYLKGTGLGLALPLRSFAVEPGSNGAARLTLRPVEDPGSWALRSWRVGGHFAAVAKRGEHADLRLSVFSHASLPRGAGSNEGVLA